MNEREIITHIVHPLLELLDLAKNTKDLATINKLNEALTKRYLYCMSLLELVAMYAPAGKLDEVFQHLTLKNNAKFRNKFVLNLIEDSASWGIFHYFAKSDESILDQLFSLIKLATNTKFYDNLAKILTLENSATDKEITIKSGTKILTKLFSSACSSNNNRIISKLAYTICVNNKNLCPLINNYLARDSDILLPQLFSFINAIKNNNLRKRFVECIFMQADETCPTLFHLICKNAKDYIPSLIKLLNKKDNAFMKDLFAAAMQMQGENEDTIFELIIKNAPQQIPFIINYANSSRNNGFKKGLILALNNNALHLIMEFAQDKLADLFNFANQKGNDELRNFLALSLDKVDANGSTVLHYLSWSCFAKRPPVKTLALFLKYAQKKGNEKFLTMMANCLPLKDDNGFTMLNKILLNAPEDLLMLIDFAQIPKHKIFKDKLNRTFFTSINGRRSLFYCLTESRPDVLNAVLDYLLSSTEVRPWLFEQLCKDESLYLNYSNLILHFAGNAIDAFIKILPFLGSMPQEKLVNALSAKTSSGTNILHILATQAPRNFALFIDFMQKNNLEDTLQKLLHEHDSYHGSVISHLAQTNPDLIFSILKYQHPSIITTLNRMQKDTIDYLVAKKAPFSIILKVWFHAISSDLPKAFALANQDSDISDITSALKEKNCNNDTLLDILSRYKDKNSMYILVLLLIKFPKCLAYLLKEASTNINLQKLLTTILENNGISLIAKEERNLILESAKHCSWISKVLFFKAKYVKPFKDEASYNEINCCLNNSSMPPC